MSYMDLPRIHFAGTFTTKPSTVNNLATNYKVEASPPSPVWSPNGNAYWLLSDCSVTSVVDGDGNMVEDAAADSLVGKAFAATNNWGNSHVPAKIVDLDPEQQMVSMIYGLQLQIGVNGNSVTGNFRPVWFQDLWGQGTGRPAGSIYQSVLESITWGDNLTSLALQKLLGTSPDLLSIKFVVDAPQFVRDDRNPKSPMVVCIGRIIGTIGPGEHDAPYNFVPARFLTLPSGTDTLNFAPALVDTANKRLTIDLGNSIPWASANGTKPDLGDLQVAIVGPKDPPILLGAVDYSVDAYRKTALVQDFDLSDEAARASAHTPISIVQVSSTGNPPSITATLLREDPSGVYVNAMPYVFRIQANSTADAEFVATRFGKPIEGLEIYLQDVSSKLMSGPGLPPVGTPRNALQYPQSVMTDEHGHATLTLSAGDPKNPREYIDGQVYAIAFSTPAVSNPDPNNFLSILVHNSFDVASTWENIQPIMQQYARLYPFMNQNFFQLDDPAALQQHANALIQVFSYPIEDPRYMPVVRDLSDAKRSAIIAWLKAGAPTI